MRADRLLSLVLLLRSRGRMTASVLARELECSTRTVLRDVEALSAAGVPVYAERGRDGGFELLPGYRTDLTGLTHDEALALLVAGSRTAAPGMAPALASAMRKVVAALSDTQRDRATSAADRILLRPDRMLPRVEADDSADDGAAQRLQTVQRAAFAGRKLRMRYAATGEDAQWRTVDPLGLVEAGGKWYLLATRDGADRTYRLSRMLEVQELPEAAERDPTVDLERAWEQRRADLLASLPQLAARIRVAPHLLPRLRRTAIIIDAERPAAHGLVDLELRFGGLTHAENVLWVLAPDAEALHPPELRTALAARAHATAHRHTPASRNPGAHELRRVSVDPPADRSS